MNHSFGVRVGIGTLILLLITSITPIQAARAPLYLTTMTHMESSFMDDRDRALYDRHLEQLTYGMDLADAYGAKLTIESEKPFARADAKYGVNFMSQILARGHGVGTHCDVGFKDPLMSSEQFAAKLRENKALVDALVGPENNLGCSGAGGVNDYVIGAHLAGFSYLNGIVSMHYLSMPLENRPSPQWTNEYIQRGHFHENAPLDLEARIYPFRLKDASDFVPDEDGVIVISAGDLGGLIRLQETAAGKDCRNQCTLTRSDVDEAVRLIREVDSLRDPNKLAKASLYLEAAIFVPENEDGLRYFFSQMQALAAEGVITWATQADVYRAFAAHESAQ